MNKNLNRLNTKGFMLLETLIVSTVVLGTLVFLYVQFVNVKSSYEVSFRYNTVPGLFMAKEVANFIEKNGYNGYINLQNNLNSSQNGFLNITSPSSIDGDSTVYTNIISSMDIRCILFTSDNLSTLKEYLTSNTNYEKSIFNEEFKRYILKLNTENTTKSRIIIAFNNNTFASVLIGGA